MTVDPEQGVDRIFSSYVSLVVRMWIINANLWFVATAFLRMTSQYNIVISGMIQNK
jgi:type IV secretory pathway TrbD component